MDSPGRPQPFRNVHPRAWLEFSGISQQIPAGLSLLKDSKKHWFVVYYVGGRKIHKQLALAELRG